MLRSCSLAVSGNDRHSAGQVRRFINLDPRCNAKNVLPIDGKHARTTEPFSSHCVKQ
jgi:hypothetical protein